ncbi:MAG: hypothetical protein N3D16_08545, partial [Anaerolineales bacterium]|nr:hypothetical protein [Anaerolineales bacterium]
MGISSAGLETPIKAFAPLFALLITLGCESLVLSVFARWQNKPLKSLLLSGLFINLATQPFLWFWLAVFYRAYGMALLCGEGLIFLGEAILLKLIPVNYLSWREAFLLSLMMNALSFG